MLKTHEVIKCAISITKKFLAPKVDGMKFRLALTTVNASARYRNIKLSNAMGRVLLEGSSELAHSRRVGVSDRGRTPTVSVLDRNKNLRTVSISQSHAVMRLIHVLRQNPFGLLEVVGTS